MILTPPQLRIKEIETAIHDIMGECPESYYRDYGEQTDQAKLLRTLAWERKCILDKAYIDSSRTRARREYLENVVYDLKRKMMRRMLTLYRLNIQTGYDPDFDHDYELMGRIEVGVYYDAWQSDEENDSVITMYDDDYYGSDFKYMLPAIRAMHCHGESIIDGIGLTDIRHRIVPKDTEPTVDDLFFMHHYELEDNKPWSEKRQELVDRGIRVESPLDDFDGWAISLPDILRINSFDIQVELWCQHFGKL